MSRITGPNWSVEVSAERIDVTSEHPTPDERWKFTDAAGHEHYYDKGYPTLTYVIDAEHWCDGSEGWAHHDPHMAVDEAHYECTTCGEKIAPKTVAGYTPRFVNGPRSATISGTRSDGATIEAPITEAEMEAFFNGEPMQALLDSMPLERCTKVDRTSF